MKTNFLDIIKYFPDKRIASIYTENKEELSSSDIVVIDDWTSFQYLDFNEEKQYVIRTTLFDFIEWSRMINKSVFNLYIYFSDYDNAEMIEKVNINRILEMLYAKKIFINVLNN